MIHGSTIQIGAIVFLFYFCEKGKFILHLDLNTCHRFRRVYYFALASHWCSLYQPRPWFLLLNQRCNFAFSLNMETFFLTIVHLIAAQAIHRCLGSRLSHLTLWPVGRNMHAFQVGKWLRCVPVWNNATLLVLLGLSQKLVSDSTHQYVQTWVRINKSKEPRYNKSYSICMCKHHHLIKECLLFSRGTVPTYTNYKKKCKLYSCLFSICV
jgi:hypothetical protein